MKCESKQEDEKEKKNVIILYKRMRAKRDRGGTNIKWHLILI